MNCKRFLGHIVAGLVVMSGACSAATVDRLRQDGVIRIAYRRDAPPFSYQNGDAKPGGFIVDLCQAVAKRLSQQLGMPSLKVSYVPVTASYRFDVIQQSKADMLCEATTVTLSRRKMMDFLVDTFVDGAGLITTIDGPKSLKAMAGQKIGVLAGTTTEQALKNTLASEGIAAADRTILWVLQANSKSPDRLLLANEYLTIEPYPLGLPKGDDDFRYQVDRTRGFTRASGEAHHEGAERAARRLLLHLLPGSSVIA